MAPVRRHFPPTTSRTRFSPERILETPPHALRKIFAIDSGLLSETPLTVDFPEGSRSSPGCLQPSPSLNFDDPSLVPKPAGEAGRRATDERDGYCLRDALNWDDALYLEVMVRTSLTLL
jgi:hypothetical protein